MSAALATLALAAVAALGFALLTSLATSAAWPVLRRRSARWSAASRARLALALAVAPGLLPLLLVALCFAPAALGLLGLHADHCAHHPAHPHLCFVHATTLLTAPLGLLLAGLAALLGVAAWRLGRRVARTRRALAGLRAGSSRELERHVRCVESERPFAFTAGLGRGEIFVSTALAEALSARQLEVVVEHERAHARRRDGARLALARAASWAHRPALRREILARLELAVEQACDAEAAHRCGDRLGVAETVLAVERLLAAAPPPGVRASLAFGGSSVAARVRALLEEPQAEPAARRAWWLAAVLLPAACLLADPLHHATEHALGLLLGAR
ncbi:MAG: M56 family metallopeptidase [Myxococcota bacterium]|nr:M56 family metallopeptidase [Myxococcota bacterium]